MQLFLVPFPCDDLRATVSCLVVLLRLCCYYCTVLQHFHYFILYIALYRYIACFLWTIRARVSTLHVCLGVLVDRDRLVHFYPRDAMLARVFAIATCLSVRPSVRPSVCLSHAGIVPSRAKAGS